MRFKNVETYYGGDCIINPVFYTVMTPRHLPSQSNDFRVEYFTTI